MTNITQQKILEKLQSLDEYLKNLKILQKEIKSEKQFLNDFHYYGLTERYLQLASQCLIDVLDLIIIEQKIKKPDNRKEVISLLYNQKIISEELASRLEGISGFRNILVHEYGKINRKMVYKNLNKNISDFEKFKKEILNWIN